MVDQPSLHSSKRSSRRGMFAVIMLSLLFSVLPSPTAEAYYTEGTQLPGTVQVSSGGGSSGGGHRCGSASDPFGRNDGTLWRKEANGVWRVEIINYPGCTRQMEVVVNTATNQTRTIDIDDPTVTWSNEGHHFYCVKYLEVLRFYGPRTNPAQHVTRSVAYPSVPCAQTGSFQAAPSRFGLTVPHPHDAGVSPNDPIFQSTGTYATTKPLNTAWQPQAASCPRPDDTAGLRRFFTTDWDDPDEASLAQGVRQGFSTAYAGLLSQTRAAGLPDSVATRVLNSAGTRRYAGDSFTTVNYSDGIPCSSPLDFTVPHGQTPWVYGVCAAPVITSYRGTFYVRQGSQILRGVVESYPDGWDTRPDRPGYKRHLPDYAVEYAYSYFGNSGISPASSDAVVNAYRNRAASILGRTDQFQYRFNPNVVGRAAQMAQNLPCAYGEGPIEPDAIIIEDREPVDPVVISGPRDALAYVGGVRTAQTFTFSPSGSITCNGGQSCTQGQVIERVVYSPTVSVPRGWTECTANNRGSCDYRWSWSRSGNTTLRVHLETYTATRPGEAITVTPRANVVIRYPRLETDAGNLTFNIVHTTHGFQSGLNLDTQISIPMGPGTATSTVTVAASPQPSDIEVAGSRMDTER